MSDQCLDTAASRSFIGRLQGLSSLHLFPLFSFVIGIVLELCAFVLQYNWGRFNCLDEAVSLVAGVLMMVGALRVISYWEGVSWVILAAAISYLISKGINVTRNITALNTLPIIGRDDIRSQILENVSFVLGGLVLLASFLRTHLEVHRARTDLAARNEALLKQIDERRLATEALGESERKLQLIINQIPQQVFWKDIHSVYLGCNKRHAAAAGLGNPAEIVGKTDYDLAWKQEEANLFLESDRAVIEKGIPLRHLRRQRHNSDGRTVWEEVNKVPLLDTKGRIAGVLGTSEDISEQIAQESERARLATAIEQAAESVVITDAAGAIQYVNPAFEKITGYARAEVIGNRPSVLKSGYHDHAFYKELWQALLRGEVWHGHLINRRKDGTLYEEDATISPVRDEAGDIINFVAIKRDVTKEVTLERQLLHASKMEALGTLASGVAHDFRNILSLVMGCCELLLNQLDNDHPAWSNIKRIQQAGNRGASLIRQIQTFTRQEPQERQYVPVFKVVREALDLLRSAVPASITLESRLDPASGTVYADPTQIHQVAVNLCANAYQSILGPSGAVIIEVQSATLLESVITDTGALPPGEYVCLSVSDTGQGMDARTRQHMFDPFFTTKRPGEGTGLGLAIVHGIITGNGGGISVNSTPGKGSSFTIYLPRITEEEPASEPETAKRPNGDERVFVVDDEEDLASITVDLLQDLGYRVRYFTSGEEALAAFAEAPDTVDIVVSDLIMPGFPGSALAKELLRLRPGLPILFTTGGGDMLTHEQVQALGVRELIMKPYSAQSLGQAIRRALNSR